MGEASRKSHNARYNVQKKDKKWCLFSLSVVLSVLTLSWSQSRLLQNTAMLDWQQNITLPEASAFSSRLETTPPSPRTLPPNICVFYCVRYNTTSWTPRYLEEFEAFMSKFLLAGFQQQTMLGAVPVLDDDGGGVDARSVLTPMLRQLGWIPGRSVADHVKQRDQSPPERRCEWVVQTRVDADDYLGREFVETMVDMLVNEIDYALKGPGFCGEWWKGKPCGTSEPPDALMFSQPRLTRVYLFGKTGSKRKCLYRRKPYSTKGHPPSTGLTLALSRKSYEANGQPNILEWRHDIFGSIVGKRWKDVRELFFPADRLTLAPVTSLSGHYPWFFDSGPFDECTITNLTHVFGVENSQLLVTVPLPNVTLLDACLSNQHAQGLIARNVKFKFETCADLYAHHLELQTAWDSGDAVQHYPWPW